MGCVSREHRWLEIGIVKGSVRTRGHQSSHVQDYFLYLPREKESLGLCYSFHVTGSTSPAPQSS